jgi:signal transduction histidine kinase
LKQNFTKIVETEQIPYVEGRLKKVTKNKELRIDTGNRGQEIIITVKDTGPGISKTDMDQIFDPFFTRKKTMGMGVGLSICHGIIEDHKGTIVADNLTGGGAKFTISLPLK